MLIGQRERIRFVKSVKVFSYFEMLVAACVAYVTIRNVTWVGEVLRVGGLAFRRVHRVHYSCSQYLY